jgi:hypothetical protein
MTLRMLMDSWWLLIFVGVMMYALVGSILATLAAHYRTAISYHDRLRQSKAVHRQYVELLKSRQIEQ